ncbi:radical SAM protein [Candidatus Woesearchaeota archaeon]|nr:radical SAM protein [Candidatus Woesearchaeota archaeon]
MSLVNVVLMNRTFRKPISTLRNKVQNWRTFDKIATTGEAPLPRKVIMEATLRCNLSCHFCFRDLTNFTDVTTENMKRIIDNLGPSIKVMGFTGGETFMRTDMLEIVKYLDTKGIEVGLLTNGTLQTPEKVEEMISHKNLKRLGISIDGLRENHDSIRGKGMFDRSINTLKLINKRIKSVGVNSVMTKENLHELPQLLEMIAPYIDHYSVEYQMFNTASEVKATSQQLNIPMSSVTVWSREEKNYDFSFEKVERVKNELRVIAKKHNIGFLTEPVVGDVFEKDFYDGIVLQKHPILCGHMHTARIDPRGNLVFCHLIKNPSGSLIDTPLEKLWNSEQMKDFRKNLLKGGVMPPVCKRCCKIQ